MSLREQLDRALEELRAVYAENQRLMEGKLWVTYRMEDGSDIYGEFAFVTDPEFFDDTDDECRVVKETWKLVTSEVVIFNEDEDDEDEDLPPGATVTVLRPSDLLSGGPDLGDSVRHHPAGQPTDRGPDAQSDPAEGRSDLP